MPTVVAITIPILTVVSLVVVPAVIVVKASKKKSVVTKKKKISLVFLGCCRIWGVIGGFWATAGRFGHCCLILGYHWQIWSLLVDLAVVAQFWAMASGLLLVDLGPPLADLVIVGGF